MLELLVIKKEIKTPPTMRVISKYPVLKRDGEGKVQVLSGNKYEGGFNNADGDPATTPTPATPPSSGVPGWLAGVENVFNSGAVKNAVQVGADIKAIKTGQPVPFGATPPTGTGAGSAPKGRPDAAATGMSTGAKVGIAIGVIGVIVVAVLVVKHNKKA